MIKLLTTTKLRDDCYVVTVQDDGCVTGVDEKGANIYWTCSVTYNPVNGAESLKAKIENVIRERKMLDSAESIIVTDIKSKVESIDTSKLEAK